ncbi:MAG: hypothetical protein ACRDRJ_25940 [Streptosporangiaceae bacterium]
MSEAAEHAGAADRDPARLLAEMRAIGDRTSAAARGYWLPLLLFGLLICGSLPFYERLRASGTHPAVAGLPGTEICRPLGAQSCHVVVTETYATVVTALGYYWQLAIPAAVVLTVLWYRWHGRHTGLRQPTTVFLVAGLVLAELVLLVPLLIGTGPGVHGSLVREVVHAGALVIIAAVLWVLAWTERSWMLAVIVAVFLVVALPVSHYDGGGLAGGTTGAANLSLGALRLLGLIPALILLAAGAGTWLAGRLRS